MAPAWVVACAALMVTPALATAEDETPPLTPFAAAAIDTVASGPVALGSGTTVSDKATVTGLSNPIVNGTVTFRLYGPYPLVPGPGECQPAQMVFESTPVAYPTQGQQVTSPSFLPTAAGRFEWIATFEDDANPTVPGNCGDPNESVRVTRATGATISTTASATTILGQGPGLTDTATVGGRMNPVAGGTITFTLYGPDDDLCTGAPTTAPLTVAQPIANGPVTSSPVFNPALPGVYRWTAQYNGDANNDPSPLSACNAPNESTIVKAVPVLTGTASPDIMLGAGSVFDTLVVNGRHNPPALATVEFALYGPRDDDCSENPAFVDTAPVAPGTPVSSALFTPERAGTYHWVARYTGDANNAPAATPCSAGTPAPASQTVEVRRRQASLSHSASSPSIRLGEGPLTDVAQVTDRRRPEVAEIVFRLYGPDDPTCTNEVPPASTVTYPIEGGPVESGGIQPQLPGVYRWRAFYSGDDNNVPVTTECDTADSRATVGRAIPTLKKSSDPDIRTLGQGSITATATMTGEFDPSASVRLEFRLYPPTDPACSGTPVLTQVDVPIPVVGQPVTSDPYTPTVIGRHRWKVDYSGDVKNEPITDGCSEQPGESTVVTKAVTTITTTASPPIVLKAGTLSDSATVAGRVTPDATATVTFSLFGPGDATCAGPPVFGPISVSYPQAGGSVPSPAYSPERAGTYRWRATYSGDANNQASEGVCGDPAETVAVSGVTPTLTTSASGTIVLGTGSLTDTATVTGRANPVPGGLIDFRLYGPNDGTCGRPAVFESLDVPYPVAGGAVTSAPFTPTQAGTYRWVASYSGDANNSLVDGACNAPGESVTVERSTPTLAVAPSPTITLGTGSVTDTVVVNGRLSPVEGGVVDFRAFAPTDTTCSRPPVFQSLGLAYPAGGGPVASAAFSPTRSGIYRWVASYRGDANNAPVASACAASNATTVAPGRPSQRVPNRAQTRRVTASTTPRRDRTKLYTFTTTGRVTPPPYCGPTAAPSAVGSDCVLPICPADSIDPSDCTRPSRKLLCSTGKITVRFIRIAYTVSTRAVGVRPDCTYRSKVALKTSSPFRRGALTVRVRFEGNPFLLPRRASSQIVRAG